MNPKLTVRIGSHVNFRLSPFTFHIFILCLGLSRVVLSDTIFQISVGQWFCNSDTMLIKDTCNHHRSFIQMAPLVQRKNSGFFTVNFEIWDRLFALKILNFVNFTKFTHAFFGPSNLAKFY